MSRYGFIRMFGFICLLRVLAYAQSETDLNNAPENLSLFWEVLDEAMDEASRYFPGAVDPPADPSVLYDVKINFEKIHTLSKLKPLIAESPCMINLSAGFCQRCGQVFNSEQY